MHEVERKFGDKEKTRFRSVKASMQAAKKVARLDVRRRFKKQILIMTTRMKLENADIDHLLLKQWRTRYDLRTNGETQKQNGVRQKL